MPRAGTGDRALRALFALLAVGLLCLVCAPLFLNTIDRSAPQAKGGVINFSRFGSLDRPVPLRGEWKLVWRSGAPGPPPGTERFTKVPGHWSDVGPDEASLPDEAAASYVLNIKGLNPGRYMLYIPTIHAASRVVANGEVLSEAGIAGVSAATTVPTVRAHDVLIDLKGDTLELRVDLSGYHQRNDGIEGAPLFGLAKPMNQWITLHWLRSLLLLTSCLILACYGLVIFLYRSREVSWLYFSIATLAMLPVMAVFAHDNVIFVVAPGMSLQTMRLVQYLSVTVALAAIVSYTRELFPFDSPRWLLRTAMAIFGLDFLAFVIAAVVDGSMGLSQVGHYSLWVRVGGLLSVLGIVLAATLRRRNGAAVYLLGMTFYFFVMIYTDLVSNGFLPPSSVSLDLMPLGMLVMMFTQMVIMAERWATAIGNAERTSGELRQLLDVNVAIASEIQLDALLRRIVQVTSQILNADRSSLFLHDRKTDELWSIVAEGVDNREIRFPSTSGLAGDTFTTRAAANVADVYADARFNQSIDLSTGYRTRTALSVPVITRDGRTLGVMQAFNRLDGSVFEDADMARMSAFAAQAAVAIENATLFGEVATERNYNDSILRSMSSGVVTLDREASVVKLNAAACAILGVEPEAAVDPETQRAWATNNPWLSSEITIAGATGNPKSFLDADLVTVRGDTISANVSIVPLMVEDDAEQAGLLIIVEDISEGKRMQGAMRRFMTQNVVDQIMGREDELLFGAACQASVLFADIRGFTGMAEQLGPRGTVDMLNEIFTELFEAVASSDGLLDKFMGDALMAVYGAPISSDRDPLNAVDSAVAMSSMLVAINERRAARGGVDLRLGVGIASGEVVAGTIGSPKRMDYTVIGDSVNLASRLEKITKTYGVGIVVCEDTAKAVAGAHRLRELDIIRVRGRMQPSKIFQIVTADTPLSDAAMEAYARGRNALLTGAWDAAIVAFETALNAAPGDVASGLMLERARILAETPPVAGWDGVWDSARAA